MRNLSKILVIALFVAEIIEGQAVQAIITAVFALLIFADSFQLKIGEFSLEIQETEDAEEIEENNPITNL